jgi:hypothetical protein
VCVCVCVFGNKVMVVSVFAFVSLLINFGQTDIKIRTVAYLAVCSTVRFMSLT